MALDEAERLGMISPRLARDVRELMEETGRLPSDLLAETGGEPLSEQMLELVRFLEERGE
jgi:hypothetical protein